MNKIKVLLLLSYILIALVIGDAIIVSWKDNHTNPLYVVTCMIYAITTIILFPAILFILFKKNNIL